MDRNLPARVPRPPRPQWDELPSLVRRGIEQAVGGSLTPVQSLGGGYGPGLASLMERDDGHRFFVKAISAGITPEVLTSTVASEAFSNGYRVTRRSRS